MRKIGEVPARGTRSPIRTTPCCLDEVRECVALEGLLMYVRCHKGANPAQPRQIFQGEFFRTGMVTIAG